MNKNDTDTNFDFLEALREVGADPRDYSTQIDILIALKSKVDTLEDIVYKLNDNNTKIITKIKELIERINSLERTHD